MNKAISLMELLIVMSIMAIITAIAIPSIRNYLPSLQLSSASREIQGKLRQAQEEAVTTQIRHGIKFNTTVPPTIEFIKFQDNETSLETITLNGITAMTLTGIANSRIMFSADGGLSPGSTPGTITIAKEAASKTISVSAIGVIKFL